MKKIDLNRIRLEILDIAKIKLINVGWQDELLNSIEASSNFSKEQILSVFPEGYISILKFYLTKINDKMTKESTKINLSKMGTTEKIKKIILVRFKINQENKELIKKTFFFLMHPKNNKILIKTIYNIVDQIWFIAKDESTDFNFYSKRLILSAIYIRTMIFWLKTDRKIYEIEKYLDKELKKTSKIPKIKSQLQNPFKILNELLNISKNFSFFKQ